MYILEWSEEERWTLQFSHFPHVLGPGSVNPVSLFGGFRFGGPKVTFREKMTFSWKNDFFTKKCGFCTFYDILHFLRTCGGFLEFRGAKVSINDSVYHYPRQGGAHCLNSGFRALLGKKSVLAQKGHFLHNFQYFGENWRIFSKSPECLCFLVSFGGRFR